MLWLDTLWVQDLIYIFMPHLSFFVVIFSTLTSSHHFFRHHISPHVIFVLFIFSHHCLLDTILVSPWVVVFHMLLHGGRSHPCMEDVLLMDNGSDLILRDCLVSENSRYINMWGEVTHVIVFLWEVIHYWSKYVQKRKRKKDRAHCSFYHSPLSTCIDVLICFIEFMCWRVHMRALRDFPFTRFYLDMYFWVREYELSIWFQTTLL